MSKSLGQIVQEKIGSGSVDLPVFDRTAVEMQKMIDRQEFDPNAVEKLVGGDPALSSAVLRHANSSFFGGIDKVLTVRDAIMRLGVKQVAELVILSSQGDLYEMKRAELREITEKLWRHAVGCGRGSQWLAKKLDLGSQGEEAFLCGLFHDIGKLVVVRVLDELIDAGRVRYVPSAELIVELLGGLHESAGEMLMQEWNMPDLYVRIVGNHHAETWDEHDALGNVLRLTDTACNSLGIGVGTPSEVNLAACAEAQHLRASEVLLAEFEIRLEDAMTLAKR